MFPERLAQIRGEFKLTQAGLAEKLGMSVRAISAWESGFRKPSIEKLGEIADILGVSTEFLLGRTDDPTPPSLDEQLSGVEFALYGEIRDLSDDQKRDVLDYLRFKRSQQKKK